MRFCLVFLVLLVTECIVASPPSYCVSLTKDDSGDAYENAVEFYFGLNDGELGDAQYEVWFQWNYETFGTNMYIDIEGNDDSAYDDVEPLLINQVPVIGGFNFSYDNTGYFYRTANLVCSPDNQTFSWGPSYPDYRAAYDTDPEGSYEHLEVFEEWSAPRESSHLRYIFWVTNKSDKEERLRIGSHVDARSFALDQSPIGQQRYHLGVPRWVPNRLTSVHGAGPNARDTSFTIADDYGPIVSFTGTIKPSETKGVMIIYQFGYDFNRTQEMAAWVDSEPVELFTGLTADQISFIVNWGGCQAALAPEVEIAIMPPAECGSESTSDFTVMVNTTNSEYFTSPFTHRVVSAMGSEIVAPQESTTVSVPNNSGQVKHQLWYRDCLVVETAFDSCESVDAPTSASPVAASVPIATPSKKTSGSSFVAISATGLVALAALL